MTITDTLDFAIDQYKDAHRALPGLLRLGRMQVAALHAISRKYANDAGTEATRPVTPNYRDILIEEADTDDLLECCEPSALSREALHAEIDRLGRRIAEVESRHFQVGSVSSAGKLQNESAEHLARLQQALAELLALSGTP